MIFRPDGHNILLRGPCGSGSGDVPQRPAERPLAELPVLPSGIRHR